MLRDFLIQLESSGTDSFEDLVRKLLTAQTGFEFRLAKSGSQNGRDGRSVEPTANCIMFECKRYDKTKLSLRELIGELNQAAESNLLEVWLLISTAEISDQITSGLEEQAKKNRIGFLGLDCSDNNEGLLPALCAAHSELVKEALNKLSEPIDKDLLENSFQKIKAKPYYQDKLKTIELAIQNPVFAWEAWRRYSSSEFKEATSTETKARTRFGQKLDVGSQTYHLIHRPAISEALDNWYQTWPETHKMLCVIGEEGDGKTWAVADWLSKKLAGSDEFPPIIFHTSIDFESAKTFSDLLREGLEHHVRAANINNSFLRWAKSSRFDGKKPVAIVILDGINEKAEAREWRRIFQTRLDGDWLQSVAVICTARTQYWNPTFKDLNSQLDFCTADVQPYSDFELSTALEFEGLTSEDFPVDLLSLLRKPRYFDLVLKHKQGMIEAKDFTVSRLIYQDWKDRYERKTSTILTNDDFNKIIINLSERFVKELKTVPKAEILTALGIHQKELFVELASGGVLEDSPLGVKVKPNHLALGLGLLLSEQLRTNLGDGIAAQEILDDWTKACQSTDIHVKALEIAAIHSVETNQSPELQSLTLFSWLDAQNHSSTGTQQILGNLYTLVRESQAAFVKLIERSYNSSCENYWLQDLVLKTAVEWSRREQTFLAYLKPYLTEWLGFVPLRGQPIYRSFATDKDKVKQNIENVQKELKKIFRTDVLEPAITTKIGNYKLSIVDDDGLLRLGLIATIVISSFKDHSQFIDQIMTYLTCASIFSPKYAYSPHLQSIYWIVKSSEKSLEPELILIAKKVCQTDGEISLRLVENINESLGIRFAPPVDQEIQDAPKQLESEIKTSAHTARISKDHLADASKEILEVYPNSEDANPWTFLFHARKFATDPNFKAIGDLELFFKPVFERFRQSKIWPHNQNSDRMFIFEDYEPLLARLVPTSLCDLIRENFSLNSMMQGTAQDENFESNLDYRLPHIQVGLLKYDLLVGEAQRKALNEFLQEITPFMKPEYSAAEAHIFQRTLPLFNPDDQLDFLLQREDKLLNLATFAFELSESASLDNLRLPSQLSATLLFYLTKMILPLLSFEDIEQCASSSDPSIRALILRYIHAVSDTQTTSYWVENCNWSGNAALTSNEQEFGAKLLIDYFLKNNIIVKEQLDRIPDTRLGTWFAQGPGSGIDVSDFAIRITEMLSRMVQFTIPIEMPEVEIYWDAEFPTSIYSAGVVHPEETSLISWKTPHENHNSDNLFISENLSEKRERVNTGFKKRYDAFDAVTKEGFARGHYWVSANFNGDGLRQLLLSDATLLDQWLTPIKNAQQSLQTEVLRSAGAFYQTLACILMEIPSFHQEAEYLYRILRANTILTKLTLRHFNISLVDQRLIAAPSTEFSIRLWQETFDECKSDSDLLTFSLMLRSISKECQIWRWLNKKLDDDKSSGVPFFTARAYLLQGFLGTENVHENGEKQRVWLNALIASGKNHVLTEKWCRYWFEQFCVLEDLDAAWSAFRLLLTCCNRTIWLWLDEVAATSNLSQRKKNFIEESKNEIESACNRNEQNLRETFLGLRILSELYPWLEL